MRLTRVLLDANILLDAQARDLFLRFAAAEQIEVFWSQPILAETRRNLIAKRGMTEDKADGLFDAMASEGSLDPSAVRDRPSAHATG